MLIPPPAVRESMKAARVYRAPGHMHSVWKDYARRETREILRALKALRRQEEANLLPLAGRKE